MACAARAVAQRSGRCTARSFRKPFGQHSPGKKAANKQHASQTECDLHVVFRSFVSEFWDAFVSQAPNEPSFCICIVSVEF